MQTGEVTEIEVGMNLLLIKAVTVRLSNFVDTITGGKLTSQ